MLKNLLLIFFGLFFTFLIIFIYQIRFSDRARKAYENVENSERLSEGMNLNQVIEVMGKPDTIYPSYFDKSQDIYYYEPPFAASSGIEIYIDSLGVVDRIILFE
jgi:hypothetical protein